MFLTFLLLSTWVLLGFICSQIAKKKNRNPTTWFYVGFFLGIIGVLLVALLPAQQRAVQQIILTPTEIVPIQNPVIQELRQKHWYYLDKNQTQLGPMSFDAFKRCYQEGKFFITSYVWNEDLENWKKLEELNEYHESLEIEKT